MVNYIKKEGFLSLLKGVFVAILFSLLLLLIFSMLIKLFSITDGVIKPVNQVIKIVSIFFACKISIRTNSKGLLKGAGIGLLLAILYFLIFSLFNLSFEIGLSFLIECVFMTIIGGILGIIVVNIRK